MSRLCKLDAPLVAFEQLNPEIFFQLLDLPAQRRLRDVQPLRRFAEIQILRNGDEVSDVTQFHGANSTPVAATSVFAFCSRPAMLCPLILSEYQRLTKDVLDSISVWQHSLASHRAAPGVEAVASILTPRSAFAAEPRKQTTLGWEAIYFHHCAFVSDMTAKAPRLDRIWCARKEK